MKLRSRTCQLFDGLVKLCLQVLESQQAIADNRPANNRVHEVCADGEGHVAHFGASISASTSNRPAAIGEAVVPFVYASRLAKPAAL
jgi:hypothetical protein